MRPRRSAPRPPAGGWWCAAPGCPQRTYTEQAVRVVAQRQQAPYEVRHLFTTTVRLCPEHFTDAFEVGLRHGQADREEGLWSIGTG